MGHLFHLEVECKDSNSVRYLTHLLTPLTNSPHHSSLSLTNSPHHSHTHPPPHTYTHTVGLIIVAPVVFVRTLGWSSSVVGYWQMAFGLAEVRTECGIKLIGGIDKMY